AGRSPTNPASPFSSTDSNPRCPNQLLQTQLETPLQLSFFLSSRRDLLLSLLLSLLCRCSYRCNCSSMFLVCHSERRTPAFCCYRCVCILLFAIVFADPKAAE